MLAHKTLGSFGDEARSDQPCRRWKLAQKGRDEAALVISVMDGKTFFRISSTDEQRCDIRCVAGDDGPTQHPLGISERRHGAPLDL